MAKTTLQTKNKNEDGYVKFVENILVKLTENVAIFPEPDPSIADLQIAFDGFKRAQADATYRDMRLVKIKNQQFAQLKQMVYELSLYVEKVAKGDPTLILAAGFMPSKLGMPIGPAPKPLTLRANLKTGHRGMMQLQVNTWKGALMYRFEYRKKSSTDDWVHVLSAKSKVLLTGLESMQEYEFRVAYLGRDPMVTYSDVLTAPVF
ncbi:fibronectin type III domain-containing protein [Sphingobacterium wenxiniae]|uniref:Fibronectin type III domain-containing protein n=1 Tax=Sphingobacterium wenxiniae TaxID=683125 RepID=A0A1I6UN19_9SPHI|nr:fibronectin type III domain-containing protein [Sphingobacterium wenxiniae]SFT02788.1 hypothetical protein SAMN05660206_109120 [Sphingobacterium wenxiniae]